MKRENRFLPATELRVSQSDKGDKVIAGYAVVYNSLSEDMGFREQIAPGAFTKFLATQPDIRCLFNHDDNKILGRTASGTLTLSDDAHGLAFRCVLPNTQYANDLSVSIERGDVSQCSFGMVVKDAQWSNGPNYKLRTIKEATIFDVSPVAIPAYTATSVSMRSLFPDGEVEVPEVRDIDGDVDATTTSSDCSCPCPECVAGDCANCSDVDCTNENCRCMEDRCNGEMETNSLLLKILERRTRYMA